jgi:phage FluMu protein Com
MKPASDPDRPDEPARRGAGRENRCACGSLLARITPQGVELKCRRCKRLVLVPWSNRRQRTAAERSRYPP